jgi:hypothetical protein
MQKKHPIRKNSIGQKTTIKMSIFKIEIYKITILLLSALHNSHNFSKNTFFIQLFSGNYIFKITPWAPSRIPQAEF